MGHNPLSIKVCVLLNKEAQREVEILPDYCCFEIENKFVVGYGLDFDNKYRNLPYVAVLEDKWLKIYIVFSHIICLIYKWLRS